MNEFLPHDMILKAQRFKYKYLAVPAVVIIFSFFTSNLFADSRWASLVALAGYFALLYIFRFNRTFSEHEESEVTSPVNGKVTNVEVVSDGAVLTIRKPFFASSEIVTCTKNDLINEIDKEQERVCWKVEGANSKVFYTGIVRYHAVLIGVAAGNAVCEMFVPAMYGLTVEVGQKVEAGMSVIAERSEV